MQLKQIDFMKNGWVRAVLDDEAQQKRYTFIDINGDKKADFFMVESPEGRSLHAKKDGAAYLEKLDEAYREKLSRSFTHWKYPTSENKQIEESPQIIYSGSTMYVAAFDLAIKIYCSPEVSAKALTKKDGEAFVEGIKISIREQGRKIIHPTFTIQIESDKAIPACPGTGI